MNDLICRDTPSTCDASTGKDYDLVTGVKLFEAACENGLKLAKSMGDGWSAIVWENCGWHYRIQSPCRRVNIYLSSLGDSFSAGINIPGETGSIDWGKGKTPQAAMKESVRLCKKRVAYYQSMVEGL